MTTLQLILIAAFISLTILLAIGRTLYLRSVRVRNQLRLSQILTNIAHEMLTPLTILSASVEKLRSEQAETMHEEAGKAREGADRITEYDLMDLNIQRGVRLLQQILETSKSQAGELKLLVSNGDVMLFITETARCFLPLMHSKGLDFHIDCNPESMMGWMDTDKVDKILYNLLSNAAKYTPAGGQVRLEVRTNKHFDRIILQVSDTGQGISKEQMKHLFSRFFDGDEPIELYIGVHADDAAISAYPDCSAEFVDAISRAILVGTYNRVKVVAPFVKFNKAAVVKYGLSINVPYQLTWSCYDDGKTPCGKCATCLDRAAAFKACHAADPALNH